jgi:transcriptional regulator with XRE-family HTH domain
MQNSDEQRPWIGPSIQEGRQKLGLSLSELAGQTDISVSYLSRLEKGRSVPSFMLLSRIGGVLGVDLSYFAETEEAEKQLDKQLTDRLLGAGMSREAVLDLRKLKSNTRKELNELLEQLPII